MPGQADFPTTNQLWRGAMLATIAHAIWVTAHPLLSYELSWDRSNYNRQDSQGTRGTITFAADGLVGVFRDDNDSRVPWRSEDNYDLAPFFRGMPTDLLALARQEALQYLFDEYSGIVRPTITTAFWSVGEYVTAAEPWPEVLRHGAHLIRIEVMETEAAITEWQVEYEWSDSEITLLRSLFTRKMATADAPIVLEDWERNALMANGNTGIDDSRELLTSIGIVLT